MVLKQLDIHMSKNEVRLLYHILCKHSVKVDHRPKCKSKNYMVLRRKHKSLYLKDLLELSCIQKIYRELGSDFLDTMPKV